MGSYSLPVLDREPVPLQAVDKFNGIGSPRHNLVLALFRTRFLLDSVDVSLR
jgi:hypothetical protein